MANNQNLRAIITGIDRLSPMLRDQMRTLGAWRRQLTSAGKGGATMGAGLVTALALPTKAFIEAENAATQLQNTLMNQAGVSAGFAELSKIAIELGNKLPGTTADFMAMASQLKSLGVSTEVLTGGALNATAYLAVVGKPLGVTYETAAEAVGKLANAFGIVASDLVPFADVLQRTLHMGIDLQQMQYAMARVSGPLKAMGKQGIGVAKDLVPLVAMLIQAGVEGEQAGTGIKKMIEVSALKGKFTNISALVGDLEKLNTLDPAKKMEVFKKMFGEEHAGKAMIIAAGGYDAMLKKMEAQASLQQRINNSLGTLGNLWEAATGTFTNAMVALATAYAPELKQLADSINTISAKLQVWSAENGKTIKTVIEMAGAFIGLKLAFATTAIGIGLITAAMRANPLVMILQAIALAAPLIINNWGEITDFFKTRWEKLLNTMSKQFHSFVAMIEDLINGFRSIFNLGDIKLTLPSLPQGFADGLGGYFSDASNVAAGGMRPPGQAQLPADRKSILAARSIVSGGISVDFNNAPQGMRVNPGQIRGPLAVTPNVGYRSILDGL